MTTEERRDGKKRGKEEEEEAEANGEGEECEEQGEKGEECERRPPRHCPPRAASSARAQCSLDERLLAGTEAAGWRLPVIVRPAKDETPAGGGSPGSPSVVMGVVMGLRRMGGSLAGVVAARPREAARQLLRRRRERVAVSMAIDL